MTPRIAPSILACDFGRLADEVCAVAAAGCDMVHVDVMDGRFVPNITIGQPIVRAIRAATDLPLDVHLMIEEPDRYLESFAAAGADIITVHAEACRHLHRTVQAIHGLGKQAGVALNPATPLEAVAWIADQVDLVLVMSVNPGFGGQRFIPRAVERVAEVRRMIDLRGGGAAIEVDGGVTPETAGAVARAGASILVAGTAVFAAADYGDAIAALRRAAA